MKRLILMRHAKSDWSRGSADIERPLNGRGRLSARAIGNRLRAENITPDEILCSAAERTRQTLQELKLPVDLPTTITRALYLAEPEAMADILRTATGDCVLIVAHNPGTSMVAQQLAATQPSHPDFGRYPTGATLILDFDIADWGALREGSGKLIQFFVPRDLND